LDIPKKSDSIVGMSRCDLTDFEWRVIEPLLPNKPRGVPRVEDRRLLNGVDPHHSLRASTRMHMNQPSHHLGILNVDPA